MRHAHGPILGIRPALIGFVTLAVAGTSALGQVQIRDFTRPFVVLDTGGHSAPVRSLIFDKDGKTLLTAGMDKLIHVWNLEDGRGTIARTIRPAYWRGPAGAIYAMALSPVPDANGRRLLAIGGYGIWSTRGNITLFRYPGDAAIPNGEVLAQLPSHIASEPNSPGHSREINGLAFSPDGLSLASCGNDGRVIVWDVAARRPSAVLAGPGPPVNALAFSPDGLRLAAGGVGGALRLWEIRSRRLVAEKAPTPSRPGPGAALDPEGSMILTLGFAPPDGRMLVIGRENGQLVAYDGFTLNNERLLQQRGTDPVRGAVEGLAFSPDGETLAASVIASRLSRHGERPRVDCEIQLRSLPEGKLLPQKFAADNLVHALAFTSDNSRLAFAGGDSQSITIRDLAKPDRAGLELQGQGSSVWRVGWRDNRTIGFSHVQEHEGPNAEYLEFDLKGQKLIPAEPVDLNGPKPAPAVPKGLSRARTTWKGWRVETVDPLNLTVIGPTGKRFPIALDRLRDRRWWAYSFLPPGAGHTKPAVAVACEGGVVIHRLEDGVRTRRLAGHSSEVYDLAPSDDGMWLATGSSDQTVRIWSLAGCDALPSLGATFRPGPDGRPTVAAVAARGFADAMGLKPGDVIDTLAVDAAKRDSLDRLDLLDGVTPGIGIEFLVRRGAEMIPLVTTRRDSPRLTLFVGEDREWVVWTPEGYYETSVAGDRKYLGWHRNGPTLERPTDRFPAETFEKEFRKPAVLTALIDTDDRDRAFALLTNPNEDPAAIVQAQAPPVVTILTAPAPVPAVEGRVVEAPPAGLTVRGRITSEGRSPIASVRVLVDGRPTGPPTVFNPPRDAAELPIDVPPHPGFQKVVVEATNAAGKVRMQDLDVVAPIPTAKPPTLHVVTIGASGPFSDEKFPKIPFADEDAKDLRTFFAAPGERARFEQVAAMPPIFGPAAKGITLRETFRGLARTVQDPNDVLIVALESHVLIGAKNRFVLSNDTDASPQTADTPTAEEIGDALAEVAARGCKVLLLLDTSHEKAPAVCREGLTDFVRSLSRRNVIVFVAANHGASRRIATRGHGAFAQAVLDVFDARARSRPWVDHARPMSLDDFQDAVVSRVKELTGRKQFAACYIPATLSPRAPIFEPNRPQSLADAR